MSIKIGETTKLDESTFNSPNFTAAADVPSVYGMARNIDSITIHWFGDPAQSYTAQSAFAAASYLSRPGGDTSAHFAVEAGIAYCMVSPANAAWHSGSAQGNATSIGIECHPRMSDADFQSVVELVKYLESIYGSLKIYGHQDWSATQCPGVYYPRLGELIDRVNNAKTVKPSVTNTTPTVGGTLVYPVAKRSTPVSQDFGQNGTSYNLASGGHTGRDIACDTNTPVLAVGDGEIIWADWVNNLPGDDSAAGWASRWYLHKSFGGIVVGVDHGDFISFYAHLNSTPFNIGDKVKAGQEIGKSGSTGAATGPHLHWEILTRPINWVNGYYGRVNPTKFIDNYNAKRTQLAQKVSVAASADKKAGSDLSVLTEKFKNFKTGGQTDAATELGWLPQNFQVVFESISNIRKEVLNQKILKQGGTQKKGETTSLALEVSYLADNFARTHQALARIEKRLDEIEGK